MVLETTLILEQKAKNLLPINDCPMVLMLIIMKIWIGDG